MCMYVGFSILEQLPALISLAGFTYFLIWLFDTEKEV